jgi:short-subunit dehydrogenase
VSKGLPTFKEVDMKNLAGKRVLITGAGHGLGQELAQTFAAAHAKVIVTDIDLDRIQKTVFMLKDRGHAAIGYTMDVTDPVSVENVRDRLLSEHHRIDVLVNNAGVVNGGPFLQVELGRHLDTYEVNILGLTVVTHTFLRDLISRPCGHLVNIASAAGLIPLPYAATYASSKWAVVGFSDSIREELRLAGHDHVKVTNVCPSYIGTGMFASARAPKMMAVLTPQQVARKVLHAVRTDREEVLMPWLVRLIPLGKALLPRPVQRWLCDQLGVTTSMLTWQGHVTNAAGTAQPELV